MSVINESRPWESIACGCRPSEAEQMTKELQHKYGTKCGHFDPKTGNAIATSREARNAIMRFRKGADLDAGYSDFAGS